MKKIDDMPVTVKAVIIQTLDDLDGEYLKCTNMLSLCQMILNRYPENELYTAIAESFGLYWMTRIKNTYHVQSVLDLLGIAGEEVERFARHNMLISEPYPSETAAPSSEPPPPSGWSA